MARRFGIAGQNTLGRVSERRRTGGSVRPGSRHTLEDCVSRDTKTDDLTGDRAHEQTHDLAVFNYDACAELFLARSRATRSRSKGRRFDTAAEAIRFVVEGLPAAVSAGAYLLVEDARLGMEEVRCLYVSAGFPLSRDIETC